MDVRTKKFINKALKVHGHFYDYSKVEYRNVDVKVEIICPIHGSFFQTPRVHLYKKGGCNACAVERSKATNTKNTEQFLDEARTVHGQKYDYSKVKYINAVNKVEITCPVHGSFFQTPSSHLRGCGCKKCAVRMTQEDFVLKALEIHNHRYDYSKVKYDKGTDKVTIICPLHGEFTQRAESHLRGVGCPKCAGNERRTTEQFVEEVRKIYQDKYDYSKVKYENSHTRIEVICKKHGSFSTKPYYLTQGYGCPQCSAAGYSQKAIRWLEQIMKREKIHIQHAENGGEFLIPGTMFKVDGFCAETSTVYEFYGDVFHGNLRRFSLNERCHPFKKDMTARELFQQTKQREKKIKKLGYNLVVIWESDFKSDP